MQKFLTELEWPMVIIMALGLGLAPFTPPHLYEKLVMLSQGTLTRPLDWFDLVMHSTPWLLFLAKSVVSLKASKSGH